MESIFPFTKSLEANCHLRSFSSLAKCFSLSSFSSLMSPRGLASDQNPLPRLITTPSPAITMIQLVLEPPPDLRAAMLLAFQPSYFLIERLDSIPEGLHRGWVLRHY